MYKTRCYNGGNQHKFEARYTEQSRPSQFNFTGGNMSELRSLLVLNIYVRDVCIWCGKTIKKKEEELK